MIYGISGAPIPNRNPSLPYAGIIQTVAEQKNFPPCLAYAIAWRETISVEVSGWLELTYGKNISARNVISPDEGHGVFQLTSSWPLEWDDPFTNTAYAISHFMQPALHYFAGRTFKGDLLVQLVADAFNEGTARVDSFLARGLSPDIGTTNGNYGATVRAHYRALIDGKELA